MENVKSLDEHCPSCGGTLFEDITTKNIFCEFLQFNNCDYTLTYNQKISSQPNQGDYERTYSNTKQTKRQKREKK